MATDCLLRPPATVSLWELTSLRSFAYGAANISVCVCLSSRPAWPTHFIALLTCKNTMFYKLVIWPLTPVWSHDLGQTAVTFWWFIIIIELNLIKQNKPQPVRFCYNIPGSFTGKFPKNLLVKFLEPVWFVVFHCADGSTMWLATILHRPHEFPCKSNRRDVDDLKRYCGIINRSDSWNIRVRERKECFVFFYHNFLNTFVS